MKFKKLIIIIFFIVIMIITGTTAYMYIENWDMLDSLYMTIIILTTIGFREVHSLSHNGKIFTIFFAMFAFLTLAGSISIISSAIIENYLNRFNWRKKMFKKIERLKNHIIICGVGKIGKHVIHSILESNKNFVAVDKDEFIELLKLESVSDKLLSKELLCIEGDPSKEDILIKAGVKNAFGLITCMPDDAQNLFISLTAKKLNPQIKISSYVINEINISKFYLVGTDEVVSGDFVIGKRLISSIMNKNITTFLEQTNSLGGENEFYVGDVEVKQNSKYLKKSISQANIYQNTGLLIFAIKKKDNLKYIFNPNPTTPLEEGDILITFGSNKDINNLYSYINS